MSHHSHPPGPDDITGLMANVGLDEGYATLPHSPIEPGYSNVNTPTLGYGTQMSMSGSIPSVIPGQTGMPQMGMHYATPPMQGMQQMSMQQDEGYLYYNANLAPPFSPTTQNMPPGQIAYPYGGPPPDMPPMSASISDAGFDQLGAPFSPMMERHSPGNHPLPPHPSQHGLQHGDRIPQHDSGSASWRAGGNSNFQGLMSPQQGQGAGAYYDGQGGYWTPPYSEGRKKEAEGDFNTIPRLSLNHSLSGAPRYTPPHQQNNFNRSPIRYGFESNSGNFSQFETYQSGSMSRSPNPSVSASSFRTPQSPLRMGFRPKPRAPLEPARSAVLEDFRLTKQTKRWGLKDIYGHIPEFCGDAHGSRFIQQKLEEAQAEDRQKVFDEILPNAFQLMTDVFGNYVFQKLFELGDQRQKANLARKMEGQVFKLSNQMYGCRVVQKAFQHVLVDQREGLVAELGPNVLECVKSSNANHVIQLLIQLGPPDFITINFLGHVQELACHAYGCRVLQKTFEAETLPFKEELLAEFDSVTSSLIEDQFGNYVVQSVIDLGAEKDRKKVVAKIKGNVVMLSRHKFASNVCEKALTKSSGQDLRDLITELIGLRPDGTNNVRMLLQDMFGNFPLQTALRCADTDQRDLLLSLIRPVLPILMNSPVGKRLATRIQTWEKDGIIPPIDTIIAPPLARVSSPGKLYDSTSTRPYDSGSTTTEASGYTPPTRSGSSSTGFSSPTAIGTKMVIGVEGSGSRTSTSTPVTGQPAPVAAVDRMALGSWRSAGPGGLGLRGTGPGAGGPGERKDSPKPRLGAGQ